MSDIKILVDALIDAKVTIRAHHGPDGWEIYDQHSPEMKRLNQAIALGRQSLSESSAIVSITVDYLEDKNNWGKVFATGVSMFDDGVGFGSYRWIAIISKQSPDWCIYYDREQRDVDYLKKMGVKVKSVATINKLVPCSPDILARYRF